MKKAKVRKEVETNILVESFANFAQLKGIDRPTTIRVIEDVFKFLIKKRFGDDSNFEVIVNLEQGDLEIWRVREIVDDEFAEDSFDYDENKHVALSEALKIESDFEIGEELAEGILVSSFGRRSVLLAKQILAQKIKELEQQKLVEKYQDLVGEIIIGEVQGWNGKELFVIDPNGNQLVLPKSEQIYGDFKYKKGDTIKSLVLKVISEKGKVDIILSRKHPAFLIRLMELEIPEVSDGLISIRKVVRVPGEKAKVLVESYDDRIDPIGCCVGSKGSKINPIIREIRNEQIDLIRFTENEELLIQRLLPNTKIQSIERTSKGIKIYLPSDQLGLAIGKKGVNLKLISQILDKPVYIQKEIESVETDDVALVEFADEIEDWMIDELNRLGLDTAKQVLSWDRDDLIRLTDLEEEMIDNIIDILKTEFENE